MNRDVVDKWCERGILVLVLAILVFGPLATGAVRTPDFLVIQGLTMGVMLLWGTRLWLSPRPKLLWPPICWAVIAFIVYAVVRYLTADIEYIARQELIRILVYAALFLAIVNNLYRQESTHTIFLVMIFLAMGIAGYAVYQFITNSDKVWTFIKPYTHRGSGTFISPNNLGGFLEMILPLGLAWMLVSRARTLTRIFVGYASVVILAGIAVTLSRGSWISTGLALTVFFIALLFHRTYRLPAAVLLVIALGAGYFLFPQNAMIKLRAHELVTHEGRVNDDMRFELWKPTIRMWRDHPWWGVGPGLFDYRFGQYRPENVQLRPDHSHNDYLNTLADWGVAGTALVLAAWVLLYAGVFKTWSRVGGIRSNPGDFGGRQSNKLAVVLGASTALLAILAHSVVDFNMHIPANAILAITLMALLSGCLRFATERYWFTAGHWSRATLSLALIAGLGYLGWQGARRAAEYTWLTRAQAVPDSKPALKIAALQKAFAVEPMNEETVYEIGEAWRLESWSGTDQYQKPAEEAMRWFDRGAKLDPYDNNNLLGRGKCLDWIGRHEEAAVCFEQAVELDPNSYFTVDWVGWHYVQLKDYAAAREWFERSRRLEAWDNPIADSYVKICADKLLAGATSDRATLLRP